MHQVRCDGAGQRAALVVRLAHEAHVAEAQVAKTAVHELRRGARRARAEVAGVDERDREALARGVRGGGRADHATADHEEVVRCAPERLARRSAALLHPRC
jgi:hypothetical protein